jgi:hypothetical protein
MLNNCCLNDFLSGCSVRGSGKTCCNPDARCVANRCRTCALADEECDPNLPGEEDPCCDADKICRDDPERPGTQTYCLDASDIPQCGNRNGNGDYCEKDSDCASNVCCDGINAGAEDNCDEDDAYECVPPADLSRCGNTNLDCACYELPIKNSSCEWFAPQDVYRCVSCSNTGASCNVDDDCCNPDDQCVPAIGQDEEGKICQGAELCQYGGDCVFDDQCCVDEGYFCHPDSKQCEVFDTGDAIPCSIIGCAPPVGEGDCPHFGEMCWEVAGKKRCISSEQCLDYDTGFKGKMFEEVDTLLGRIFAFLYPAAIFIGIVLIIRSGYCFMTSQGNPAQVKECQEQLSAAVVGIIFVVLSVVILRIIIGSILGQPGALP